MTQPPTGLADLTVRDFLDRLASKQPTPGGGSVAALSGALAAGLGEMVCQYTLGKPKFAAVEPRIAELNEQLSRARHLLTQLIDEDAAAYAALNAAFAIDKADPARSTHVAAAALPAATVPLEAAAISVWVRNTCDELARSANPQLKSDAQAAVVLADAARLAALANVAVNLPLLIAEDRRRIESELVRLKDASGQAA